MGAYATQAACATCGILLASVFESVVDTVADDHRRAFGHEVAIGPFDSDAVASTFAGIVRQRGPAA